MIDIYYLDDYNSEHQLHYDSHDLFVQGMVAMWPPFQDHFKVTKVLYQNQEIHYQGQLGNLYYFMLPLIKNGKQN
ncbi:DUF4649 family protein [Streptococcus chenjunshii]|uniref:DUF4649 family protein n=1 Tax=Streptococcus chenjunshii TaxID=2173853 RepID=A0A372KPN9_9STRE|nr:DUF4649 family protein [Streptococcus chenjunshii]AXQ78508.1 DUF4649 family protein [Streptococcus chenjunshii]RFU52031.1 DUF4649 family protein [Streptococcus chenjunshii]RFU54223.1 DUF4649 family protein [Streptococcus chenjunshii]